MSSVPTVTLTGEALLGVALDGEAHRRAVAQLPQAVKLGRVRAKSRRNVVHLADFVDLAAADPPPAADYYTKAAASLTRMYLNDQLGCCVVSGKAHSFGVWSANDSDSGGVIQATDQEVLSQYRRWCGHLGNDSGCIIDEVLTRILNEGMVLGGKTYRIDGFAAVDHTSKKLVQVALLLTGSATIGINLPAAWTNSDVWDVTNSRIVGGHDVSVVGYDERGVYVSSWGRVYLMTWAAFLSTRWVEEMYVVLSDVWYGPDRMSPAGLDAAALKAALDRFKSGGIPDWVPPAPEPPVVPPAPVPPPAPAFPNYAGTVTLRLPVFGSISGTVTLSPVGAAAALPHGLDGWLKVAAAAGQLLLDVGARNWGAVVGDLIQLARAVGIDLPFAAGLHAATPELRVPYWKLALDVWKLVSDFRGGDYAAIPGDLAQIAADLGIDLPGVG